MNTEQAMEQMRKAGLAPPSRLTPAHVAARTLVRRWPRPPVADAILRALRDGGCLRHAAPLKWPPHLTCIPRVLSRFA